VGVISLQKRKGPKYDHADFLPFILCIPQSVLKVRGSLPLRGEENKSDAAPPPNKKTPPAGILLGGSFYWVKKGGGELEATE
jgi:hypothetical protein